MIFIVFKMIEIITYELWYIHFMVWCWKPFSKFSYIGFANVMHLLEANLNYCSDWNILWRLLGNNLVAVNRALANHGLETSQCLATAM
jgi:hypothetical protein